jgi:rhamnopyranosyl-N-acetylglucosaminyl-diphospho-decaprenol beta-1,3/1,4-galactofuranosyltransferase
MMDDDGIPDSKQLEYLVRDSIKYDIDFASALVINKDNHSITVKNAAYNKEVYDKKEIIWNLSFAFNGTFIWRGVIEKVGFIKREMFIWGDESEYLFRVKSHHLTIGTITKAIHFHPAFKVTEFSIIPYIPYGHVRFKPKPKDKIYFRNLGYIDSRYRKGHLLKYLLYYAIRLKFKELKYFLRYYRMGFNNNFSINLLHEY